jgi:citrate lyase subunit beta/citryl-CoA lyase
MVSADNTKHLNKIDELKCDIVILNLEDGVCDKDLARKLLVSTISNKTFNKKIIVRINSLESCGKDDIEAINSLNIDAIRVPKIENKKDVQQALNLINTNKEVHLSIETKEALHNLYELKIDKRVTTVYLGMLDLLNSLGLSQSLLRLDNPTIHYILSDFLLKSKTAGLYAVSFVYQNYQNIDEFKKWCKLEKSMGFDAKACISPTQVDIVNDIFGINDTEIQRAKQIKKLFENQRDKHNSTGFSDKKLGFIDEPIYKDAILLLNRLDKHT